MKKIIIGLLAIILLTGCSNSCKVANTKADNYEANEYGTISDIKEVKTVLPDFKIGLYGNYAETISKDLLSSLKVYSFKAIFGASDNSYQRTFTGIKVLDVIEYLKINNATDSYITFYGKDNKIGEYKLSEINDKCYFIFKVYDDDIYVNNENNNLTFAKFDDNANSWIYGVGSIDIN